MQETKILTEFLLFTTANRPGLHTKRFERVGNHVVKPADPGSFGLPRHPGGKSKTVSQFMMMHDRRPTRRPPQPGDCLQVRIVESSNGGLKVSQAECRLRPSIEPE